MTQLAGTLQLRDVLDVEGLVRKVAADRLRQWGARLNSHDEEDLVSYLISVCWELDGRYDPAKDKKPNFGAYAARILTLRVADWYRLRFGDTRHGERPVVLSLDAPSSLRQLDDVGDGSGSGPEVDRLVDAVASSGGDPADDCSPDLIGVLTGRSRPQPESHDQVGQQAPRRGASGDRGAAAQPVKRPRVKPTLIATVDPPCCAQCTAIFFQAFARSDKALPEPERRSKEQLIEAARDRATAIKFAGEWVCARCTTIPLPDGTSVVFSQLYPNRAARRASAPSRKQVQRHLEQRQKGTQR